MAWVPKNVRGRLSALFTWSDGLTSEKEVFRQSEHVRVSYHQNLNVSDAAIRGGCSLRASRRGRDVLGAGRADGAAIGTIGFGREERKNAFRVSPA